jgi:lysophospholipase L1-like esterase
METVVAPKKKKRVKVLIIILSVVVALVLAFAAFAGGFSYYGPFKELSVTRIQLAYRNHPQGEVIFYGASNFTLWTKLTEDMKPFSVQNHGFGGSADRDLLKEADKLLYPYAPSVVIFQSGSNDFAFGLTVDEICAGKDKMYTEFREKLPDTVFVVMSMLPLPGRAEYWADSVKINEYLLRYCETHDSMAFVDATGIMTTDSGAFRPELYRGDGIHLNREGQLLWGSLIKQALEENEQRR